MTEHWFLDYANADIEVALSDVIEMMPPDIVEQMRRKVLQIIYFQAARMALSSNNYTLMWHFLRRAKSINGVSPECLVKCEATFLIHVLVERICVIVNELGASTVLFQDNPLMQKLMGLVQMKLKTVICKSFISLDEDSEDQVYLLQLYDKNFIAISGSSKIIALADLLESLRLSSYQIGINVDAEGINISFIDEAGMSLINQQSTGFDLLTSSYYSAETKI